MHLSGTVMSLGDFNTQAACDAARDAVQLQLKGAGGVPQITCVSENDIVIFGKATDAGAGPNDPSKE